MGGISVRVKQVKLEGWGTHESSIVDIPSSGLIVIDGVNGSGKSSILTAVSFAAWGKMVRLGAKDAWTGEKGSISITVDGYGEIVRKQKGHLKLIAPGIESSATTTKAQSVLNSRIGTWSIWRRACVITSSDASAFVSAPESSRKKILEEVAGLSGADAAAEIARNDVRSLETDLIRAKSEVDRIASLIESEEDALARDTLPEPPKGPKSDDTAKILSTIESEGKKHSKVNRDIFEAESTIQSNKRRLESHESVCSKCGQSVSKAYWSKLSEELKKQNEEIDGSLVLLREESDRLSTKIAELRNKVTELTIYRTKMSEYNRAKEGWKNRTEEIESKLKNLGDKMSVVNSKLEDVSTKIGEAKAVSAVLGPKGVRSWLLADALQTVEYNANEVLEVLDTSIRLRLCPTETSVNLELVGAGGGSAYNASDGELKRVTIACCVAISRLAEARSGWVRPTLWLDEALDALDSEGRKATGVLLSNLAKDRAVVVISHQSGSSGWKPDRRIHVNSGRIF